MASKKTRSGRTAEQASLDALVEKALAIGKTAQFNAALDAADRAPLPELLDATKALLARESWPADIRAMEGQEKNLFQLRRASLLGSTFASALARRSDPAADEMLIELLESPEEMIRGYVEQTALGGELGERSTPARRPVLARLATHLRRGDPLCGAAAVAAHLLGEHDAAARLASLDDGTAAFVHALREFASLSRGRVPLTTTLWDLYRKHYGSNIIVLSEELEARAPVDVLIHALETTRACDEAIVVGLGLRADASAIPALRAALPKVADRPVAKKLEKLVERLAASPREAASRPLPEVEGVVATDGGPILLGPKRALETWAGALPEAPSDGDYADACSAAPFGVLSRGGRECVVLRSKVADVVAPGDGSWWVLLEGTLEEIWVARETLRFEPLGREIDGGGLVLLDAAYSVADARAETERVFELPTRAGAYVLEKGTEPEGYMMVLRLRRR